MLITPSRPWRAVTAACAAGGLVLLAACGSVRPTAHYLLNGRPGQEQLPSGHMGQTDAQLATISR